MADNKTVRKTLSVKGVESLLRAGIKKDHSDSGGLYLKVSGKNKGSWYFRYKIKAPGEARDKNGSLIYKVKRIGLGSVAAVTLGDAREKAQKQLTLIAQGIDPQEHREAQLAQEQAEVITFDDVAADYIKAQRPSWTNAKHASQWVNTLETYASPVIGHLAPADITTEHVLKILQPIWNTKKETASRVRNRIELVLNAAKARKLREGENVAAWRGHLELLLAKHKGSDKKNHPALPWSQITAFHNCVKNEQDVGSQALQLTILTALRTSEVLNATWSEFDLVNKVWTIPAERMKAKKEHRVPLSSAVLRLLETIPKVSSGLLFEGQKIGKPISNMAMLMKVRRLDAKSIKEGGKGWRDNQDKVITVHGFRSTFRDWAAENTRFQNHIVEQALAHTIGNAVEAAYRRGDLLEKRRELMEAWSQYVTQPAQDKVIKLRKEA